MTCTCTPSTLANARQGTSPEVRQGERIAELEEASPDDIRKQGWAVAVHNDYRMNGEPHTFWLFTKEGRAVKGEGRTDADALNAVRAALGAVP